jgi:hypothetical protein
MQISATRKGLITGSLMIIVSLLIYQFFKNFDSALQYIVYLLYISGILWTILEYKRSDECEGKFGQLFSQGFKCFVVITLMMVLFTFFFMTMHPELKEQMALAYRSELIKQGNYTPNEIESMIAKSKNNFITMLVSMAIFGYLIIGTTITVITSAILMKKK